MAAMLFGIGVTILGIGFIWFYIARPILEDYGVIGPRTVSHYDPRDPATIRVMSRQEDQTEALSETDDQTDGVSVRDPWRERLKVDKTKPALIELMVDSGWSVGEIRGVLKGDNNALGAEVDAARKRLGIGPEPHYVTPFAGRPTSARFETDPDFPYQSPA